jgi:hypothetical protein
LLRRNPCQQIRVVGENTNNGGKNQPLRKDWPEENLVCAFKVIGKDGNKAVSSLMIVSRADANNLREEFITTSPMNPL